MGKQWGWRKPDFKLHRRPAYTSTGGFNLEGPVNGSVDPLDRGFIDHGIPDVNSSESYGDVFVKPVLQFPLQIFQRELEGLRHASASGESFLAISRRFL
ncbi:hypothetical protein HQ586_10450 [Candidatus Bathyarchaeota archaeon]|nr:hypothetical protein [Candidatus Bathyarchaeota archaeon]